MGNLSKVMEGNLGNLRGKKEVTTKPKRKRHGKSTQGKCGGKKYKGKIVKQLCKKHYLNTP